MQLLLNALPHDLALRHLVRQSDWFMRALVAVRDLGLPDWCIGAGAVRNLVWDALQGHTRPSALPDIDVVYFDAHETSGVDEHNWQACLEARAPEFPWEVTNQAFVHHWFESCFGHPVRPLRSLEDAVASWPEYATAVGVSLSSDGELDIVAPYGLADLFQMTVRRNPTRVSPETYRQRVAEKRYVERWPSVTVIPC